MPLWRPNIPTPRGYSAVALDNPKDPVNVGSVLRAADCFKSSLVLVSGPRLKRWCSTDTAKAHRHIPMIWGDDLQTILPYDCVRVAVELTEGATCLHSYAHPERAVYVFGQEDGTLGDRVLSWCRDTIYVPAWNCLNLAACVNVVLYDRLTKQLNKKESASCERP